MSQPQPIDGPAPGWYAVTPQMERWWDGASWGPQTRPIAAPQAPPMPMHGKVVTKSPVRTSHTFHLLMSVLTLGLWIPVWLVVTIINKMSREKTVTRY